MNDPLYNHFLELSWRRKLTEAEQAELRAWLAAHPEAKAEFDLEAGLSTALGQLPDTPVASNFTARVLKAAEQQAASRERHSLTLARLWPWRLRWVPKAAVAGLVLGAGLFSYHQVMAARRAAEMAHSLATLSGITTLPGPEILKDFDAIQALDPSPPADEELLRLFQPATSRSLTNTTSPSPTQR